MALWSARQVLEMMLSDVAAWRINMILFPARCTPFKYNDVMRKKKLKITYLISSTKALTGTEGVAAGAGRGGWGRLQCAG